jgi:hypothetical protein
MIILSSPIIAEILWMETMVQPPNRHIHKNCKEKKMRLKVKDKRKGDKHEGNEIGFSPKVCSCPMIPLICNVNEYTLLQLP